MKTPVTLIIFNRPDTTAKVFEAVRQIKPPQLFVIADGPRPERTGEAEKCAATRAIIEQVDWKCEVFKNYSDVNLGCGVRPATGISWVFEQVEETIILEDDCLPHPTFFNFCEVLLEKYRHDRRVMHIAGSNFQFGNQHSNYSYYFSRYTHVWGWASWRRAWQYYDFQMQQLPQFLAEGWLDRLFHDKNVVKYYNRVLPEVARSGQTHLWDYQWYFTCLIQGGFGIIPNVNLVSNIGFNSDATHTIDALSPMASLPTDAMSFPLHHPSFVICDTRADSFYFNNCKNLDLSSRLQRKAQRILAKSASLWTKLLIAGLSPEPEGRIV